MFRFGMCDLYPGLHCITFDFVFNLKFHNPQKSEECAKVVRSCSEFSSAYLGDQVKVR